MNWAAGLQGLVLAAAVAGCSSAGDNTRPPERPLSVNHGVGSQFGNYAAQADGETRGPAGERCVMFNWDRPLTKDLAVRYRSESCELQERPGVMVSRDVSRTLIPLAESNVANSDAQDATGGPDK